MEEKTSNTSDTPESKICLICGHKKELSEFLFYDSFGSKKYSSICISCRSKTSHGKITAKMKEEDEDEGGSGGKQKKLNIDYLAKKFEKEKQEKEAEKRDQETKEEYEKETEETKVTSKKDKSKEQAKKQKEGLFDKAINYVSSIFSENKTSLAYGFDPTKLSAIRRKNFEAALWLFSSGSVSTMGAAWASKLVMWVASAGSVSALTHNWLSGMRKNFTGTFLSHKTGLESEREALLDFVKKTIGPSASQSK